MTRDVLLLEKTFTKFVSTLYSFDKLKGIKPVETGSLASVTLNHILPLYLPKYKRKGEKLYNSLPYSCLRDFRASYHGGRTQVFNIKPHGDHRAAEEFYMVHGCEVRESGRVYYLDINSSYPAIMMEDMPSGTPTFYPTTNIPSDLRLDDLVAVKSWKYASYVPSTLFSLLQVNTGQEKKASRP